MRNAWVIAAIAAVTASTSACKKDGGGSDKPPGGGGNASPQAAAEADKLWKLAPKSATSGAVFTGAALVQIDRALAFVNGVAGKLPGGGEIVGGLQEMRAGILGTASSYADAGIALDRGGAIFFAGLGKKDREGMVAILPIGDRDKFLATHGGTRGGDVDKVKDGVCKMIDDHYACAKTEADLALGGGSLGKKAGVDGVRGDVELVIEMPPLPPDTPFEPTGPLTIVIGVKRGEVIARANMPANPRGPLKALAKSKRSGINVDRAAGFAVLPVDIMDEAMPMDDAPKPARDLFASISGPLTAVIPAGVMDVDVRLPLSDAGPAKQFLDHCDEIGMRSPVPVTKNPDGSCTVGPLPQIGISGSVWIDGNTVRAAKTKGSVDKGTDGVKPSGVARELADYTFAYWGRGSMIGADLPGLPPEARVAIAAMSYFSELGVGVKFRSDGFSVLMVVRTIHANPDDVVAELEAAIGAGADAAKVQAIAKAHPGTPFADDVAAGQMGVMAPTAGVGVLAAVAIPAFLGYKKKAVASPADLAVNRIVKSAKTYYVMNAKFPEGDSGLTPAISACMVPGKQHMPSPDPWMNNPVWSQIEFMVDEPDYFQYQYQGTATEFTATAIADLDCDLAGVTKIVAHGTIDPSGNPVVDVTREGND